MGVFSKLSYKEKYLIFGICFGLCFPVFAILIDGFLLKGLPLTIHFLYDVHIQNPILYVIDSAPLVLGLAFGAMGTTTHKLDLLKQSLEERVLERTKQLQTSEEELRQNLEELLAVQTSLAQEKQNLENALHTLQETQTQLILSEKMASLGQLVASIAHEINTPLGAIRSSVESALSALNQTLQTFPPFVLSLPADDLTIFKAILEKATKQKTQNLSTRELRKIRIEFSLQFEQKRVNKGDDLAELLVDTGIYNLEGLEHIWESSHLFGIVEMVYKMASIRRSAENIQTATERASKIIFALKNFSRQDHSGEKILTNIQDNIETVLTLYHNQIKQNIEVVCNFADLPVVPCYPDELIQVWTNLIHNAMQAMDGKGKIEIETKHIDNQILVSIKDSGRGIHEEIKHKIFNPFFTTKKIGEGSGLGLDIVKKIIEKHQGSIHFESEMGKGTTFFVRVPLESEVV